MCCPTLSASSESFGEMAVEREEFFAVAGLVPKNDERPVVQRRGIVRDDVDDAVERRAAAACPARRTDRFRDEWCAAHLWDSPLAPKSGEV